MEQIEQIIRKRFKHIIDGKGCTIPRIAVAIAVDEVCNEIKPILFHDRGQVRSQKIGSLRAELEQVRRERDRLKKQIDDCSRVVDEHYGCLGDYIKANTELTAAIEETVFTLQKIERKCNYGLELNKRGVEIDSWGYVEKAAYLAREEADTLSSELEKK